jgi:hypothetical protein
VLVALQEAILRVLCSLWVFVAVQVEEERVHITRLLYEVEAIVCLSILLIQPKELLLM